MSKKIIQICFFVLLVISICTPAFCQYDIKNFGAKGDGRSLDTKSIQSAIDKAYKDGGGIVDIPSGTYRIGTLILKNNINLHFFPGAILLGSADIRDYLTINQKYESRTKNLYGKYFMLFAEDAKNISLTGKGIIDGNGLHNFQVVRPQNERPFTARFVNCENVLVRDVGFIEAANWTLHLLGCKDVTIDNIFITHHRKENRDGLDIDCCQGVAVSNCRFSTGDDAIVFKSTNDSMCQDIAITNCTISSGASAIKTGTESNGGFKNITVSNCIIKNIPMHAGIELMTVDGGCMQNILLENIVMENVATPIFIRLGIRARPFKKEQYVKRINAVSDITLNNINILNATLPSSIMGLRNNKIKNITISNFTVHYGATQLATAYNKVPLKELDYPMAIMFDKLPAFAFYCRNASQVRFNNVLLYGVENEKRPGLTFDNTTDISINSLKAIGRKSTAPLVYFRNSSDATVAFSSFKSAGTSLFQIENNGCKNIVFSNNVLHEYQKEVNTVASLKGEIVFDDFETATKFEVDNENKITGLSALNLKDTCFKFKLNISRKHNIQLCLLVLNQSLKPQKVFIKYDGVIQEFLVNWNEWGWAPVSLLKNYPSDTKIDFEIIPENVAAGGLFISKVYVNYPDIGFTD